MGIQSCTIHGNQQPVLLSPRIEEAFQLRSPSRDIAMVPMRWRPESIAGKKTSIVTWWVDPEFASAHHLPITDILSEEETDRLLEAPLTPVCIACFLAWQGSTGAPK